MFKKYIILRGPAVSMEFYKVIERMLGEGKKLESLELVRHILYDLAYVSKPKQQLIYLTNIFQAIGRSDAESFGRKMSISDPLVLMAGGTIHFAFTGLENIF